MYCREYCREYSDYRREYCESAAYHIMDIKPRTVAQILVYDPGHACHLYGRRLRISQIAPYRGALAKGKPLVVLGFPLYGRELPRSELAELGWAELGWAGLYGRRLPSSPIAPYRQGFPNLKPLAGVGFPPYALSWAEL